MQKMKKKKGFTLTELAIVIAVIAILIAVLVPTFVSLINSAKLSADEQAVKNMNTALTTSEATDGKPSNLADAQSVLSDAGFSTELIPTTSGYYYFWNSEYNMVLLLDLNDGAWDLIYPKTDDAEIAYTQYISCCYNLDASGTTTDQTAILKVVKNGGTITVVESDSTENDDTYNFSDIVKLANTYGETFAGATVKLTSDITGYSGDPILNFQGTFTGYKSETENYTITVAEGGITPVYGETGNGYLYYELYEANKYKFSYGLFDSVTNGGIVENLNVVYQDNISADYTSSTSATNPGNKYTYYGGIVGFLDGGIISGCNVSGTIVQYNRVGGVVGTVLSGTIDDCKVTANVYSFTSTDSGYSNAGGIVAYAGNAEPNVNIVNVTNCTVSGGTIQSDSYAGGIVARITLGIKEFNIDGTTIQSITVKTTTSSKNVGAICGNLARLGSVSVSGTYTANSTTNNHVSSGNALKGNNVTINNVDVVGHESDYTYWYISQTGNLKYCNSSENVVSGSTIAIGAYSYPSDTTYTDETNSALMGQFNGETYSDIYVSSYTAHTSGN